MDTIDRVYYINLDHRTDRKDLFLKEMQRMKVPEEKLQRMSGVPHKKGYIGCATSHANVIADAIEHGYETILVFEDDFQCTVTEEEWNRALQIIQNETYNVCMISYNLMKCIELNDDLIEILDAQTASGYLVRKSFMPTLHETFRESVTMLTKTNNVPKYACDMLWKRHQGKNRKFIAVKKKLGVQRRSFSDIEKKNVNYKC